MRRAGWIIGIAAAGALAWWLWRRRTGGAPAASPAAAPGSGGAGGAGGGLLVMPGGAGAPDYSALAAAIMALATGVQVPAIQTVSRAVPAGTTELVAGVGGRRICVLAYSASASGTCDLVFLMGGVEAWRLNLDVPAGKSGANMATAYPSYLWTGGAADALAVQATAPAHVSISYWMEEV